MSTLHTAVKLVENTFKLGHPSIPIRMLAARKNGLQFDNTEQVSTFWIR